MKKIIKTIYIFLFIIFLQTNVYKSFGTNITNTDIDESSILEGQLEEFNISSFTEASSLYAQDFLGDIDAQNILNDLLEGNINNETIASKVLSILGNEVLVGLTGISTILAIIVLHSILKSLTDSLESSNVSKIVYYAQYILIITIVLNNFKDVVELVITATENLVGFMNILIPLLITLMVYTGNIVSSSLIQPVLLFMINFIGNIIQTVLIPIILIFTSLNIVSKLSSTVKIDKLTKFMKSQVIWFLGIMLTIFTMVLSLEGTLSSSIDGITAKTAKSIVSNVIPVVGSILGDAVDSVLGGALILKNAIRFFWHYYCNWNMYKSYY